MQSVPFVPFAATVDAGAVGSLDADRDGSPTFSPPGSPDFIPGVAAEVARGGSSGSYSELPDFCDCPDCFPPGDARALCAPPGCFDYGFFDPLTRYQERCCGPFHEQMLARLELCPSVLPDGYFTSISVFGPVHDPPELPVKLLVSLGMTVEALIDYIFMVFFGHNPNDGDIFGDPGAEPRRWQVRLMPGVDVVSDASSTLLFPFPPGSVLMLRNSSRAASEVGIKFSSVLRVSRLFSSGGPSEAVKASATTDEGVGPPVPLVSAADAIISSLVADADLAVTRFSERLEAWRRAVPLFSSLPSSTFDPAFGASVGAVISAQLAGVRAALSTDRAAMFSEVCLLVYPCFCLRVVCVFSFVFFLLLFLAFLMLLCIVV